MPNARPDRRPTIVFARWLVPALVATLAACGPKTKGATETPTDTTAATVTADDDAELQRRLRLLAERLEAARVEHHIPGMAVAVVKDDTVIFAEGFGMADMEGKREAGPDTVFAVGSTTKAFTSAAVAMQVDAGAMAWDDPVAKHVPELKLKIRAPKADKDAPQPTIRDVLCHRTGFTRMGVLWASGALKMEEVFSVASTAEPIADFRSKFHYNNVTYASAGVAAARTADTTWAQMLQDRIFEPLGMGHTTVTIEAAQTDPNLAQGYRFREVSERYEAMPMRSIDSAAPSGAINSSVLDMAQWIRLQLGRGTIDGKALISSKRFDQMWSPQIKVGGPIEYGLGWMLGDWNGHRMVEHGGNIDGYTAEVGMLPDDGIGFVLLTNLNATPLQRASLNLVFDSLLGELPTDDGKTTEAVDLSPLEGKYEANFGAFEDARFTVSAKDGVLYVDVPGQTNYELKEPDDNGVREFALTNAIKVSFDLDDKGRAQVLHMYQGGLDFELPREGQTVPTDVDLTTVGDLLGRYESDKGVPATTVAVQRGHLVADVDGQMAYMLRAPDKDGRWQFRATDAIAVSFRRDAKGAVDALVLHQGGVDTPLPRVTDTAPPLPTVDDLLARGKVKAAQARLAKLGPLELRGTLRMPASGVEGTFTLRLDAEGHTRLETDLGRYGRMVESYDGTTARSVSTIAPTTDAEGKYLRQAKVASPLLLGDWTRGFDSVSVAGRVTRNDKDLIEVVLRADSLPPYRFFVDPKTGRVVETEISTLHEGVGAIAGEGEFGDYRKVMGLQIPHRISNYNVHAGATVLEVESVKKISGDPATLFAATLD